LTKHLHPSFVTAICGLPLEYHYDEYVNVIKEFGTHVVVRVRQAVVSSNRTLVNSTMLLQTANDLGVDIAHAEKNGVAGFDRTAISTRLLQKAAEKYGFRESSSPEYVLPVVVDLYELPYFVTSERLATSESEAGECFSILRSADAPESTTDKKVEQLRGNLQRALVEYVRLSRQRTIPKNETDGFVPWPNQGSKKQAKHICGDDFRSHSGKAYLLLQNASNVDVLCSNLVKALANYAEELLPPRTTTTPDSAATPTVLTTPTTTTTAAATTIDLVPTINTRTTISTTTPPRTTTSTTTPPRTTTSTTTPPRTTTSTTTPPRTTTTPTRTTTRTTVQDNYDGPSVASLNRQENEEEAELRMWFATVDEDSDGRITVQELQQALFNDNYTPFSVETIQMFLKMFDRNRNNRIEYPEFRELKKYIRKWRAVFDHFDKDHSGTINYTEISEAFVGMGYNLSTDFCKKLCARFGKKGSSSAQMNLDTFIYACASIQAMNRDYMRDGIRHRKTFEETLLKWLK
ncbi:hypothetical protein RvY_01455-2, partial [Ramazzottius varieornatus]